MAMWPFKKSKEPTFEEQLTLISEEIKNWEPKPIKESEHFAWFSYPFKNVFWPNCLELAEKLHSHGYDILFMNTHILCKKIPIEKKPIKTAKKIVKKPVAKKKTAVGKNQ